MHLSLDLPDAQSTEELGIKLGQILAPGSVVLLNGDLGTGKTTLIQGLGKGLGIEDLIDSPTFTLINEYLDSRVPLYHFDLYRLSPAQVPSLNPELYWEGVEVPLGIVAIEWAEKLPYSPPEVLILDLSYQENQRRVELWAKGPLAIAVLEAISQAYQCPSAGLSCRSGNRE
ncbi:MULTISPECIES: tRNA (adenosine(37)-N6)-threonylcarbamoyltransferase complex ATPase subunit type 1 TsaE [unclassified Roseofilum]|uniref:tRNA (adenosine(37)-N6)-threonylcarbamoyltransferase complex ATPase subunit type 1 TsaE n=1 Tax=unclassified Roseofilum TaxID=2620099 RepID=UPI000E95EFE8|nr:MULTISPECIES: tRNA (adenosine(37)-N6)-threonylcarbamoyltransferase complex ATPase subunit type 1 TsaE [unclassified Roseofilum]HBR00243.1 tRNA (adenosine(37)-N6)-threonylcarbamoyltransferase complex ATPase subunit type 1 TsaE [Cyanobacteria bacterium UBA11691]MBP0010509.1 tRNA (adenosine(37)-N6)-threonylcarbamoyltransferase complex ATPase subunit type 1 TsaE [Roseofilum sp. Belize Diploria]MBP0012029.1 tRNA (adenosine(37)-N6)-threonylcarbamoyltransferase complex ATPase subunit type 1 TsaE [Ro